MSARTEEPGAAGEPIVRAAGGAIVRRAPDGCAEVLLVHRPRYDDWSLPKGKLEPGETHEAAARREVEEETGLRCALREELEPVRYRDRKGRPKVVRYWVMELASPDSSGRGGGFEPNAEVDELRWCPLAHAPTLLSYAHDRELVRSLASRRRSTERPS